MPAREALHDYYVDKLHEHGYVSVEFSITERDADEFFTAFRGLVAEVYDKPNQRGQDIINAFRNEMPGRPYDSQGFIEQRRIGQVSAYEIGRGPGTDNKDLLHWTPRTNAVAEEYLRTRGRIPKIMRNLLGQCTDMHEAMKASARPVFQALGVEELILAPRGREIDDVHVLRPIHYVGKTATQEAATPFIANDELAELHLDRSKFTLAGLETRPGLVGAPGANAHGKPQLSVGELDSIAEKALTTPIRHHKGMAKVFAGAGFYRMPEQYQQAAGNIPALLHGVLDENPGEDRDAVVGFMNEHAGVTNCGVPTKFETGFSNIREFVVEQQKRYGGMVA